MKSKLVLLVIMLLSVALASCNDTTPITMQNYEAKLKKLKLNSKIRFAKDVEDLRYLVVAMTLPQKMSLESLYNDDIDMVYSDILTMIEMLHPLVDEFDYIDFSFATKGKDEKQQLRNLLLVNISFVDTRSIKTKKDLLNLAEIKILDD